MNRGRDLPLCFAYPQMPVDIERLLRASALWRSVAASDVGLFEDVANACLARRVVGKLGGELV